MGKQLEMIPAKERPREKLKTFGPENLTLSELLAIIIKTGTKKISVLEVARIIADIFENENYYDLTLLELKEISGIGEIKAMEILSLVEISKRLNNPWKKRIVLKTGKEVFLYLRHDVIGVEQETFFCLYLDVKCHLLAKKKLFVGTVNYTVVHQREIFKWAVKLSASVIILVHNHPSGIAFPSNADKEVTEKIYRLAKLMDIAFLDHIIIGNQTYFSFSEAKLLSEEN